MNVKDIREKTVAELNDMLKDLKEELFKLCIKIAEGSLTKGEEQGYYDIAIFKDGVTLQEDKYELFKE